MCVRVCVHNDWNTESRTHPLAPKNASYLVDPVSGRTFGSSRTKCDVTSSERYTDRFGPKT